MKIKILSEKSMFGQEDIIKKCNRQCTAICDSLNGKLIKISKLDFLRRVAREPVTK